MDTAGAATGQRQARAGPACEIDALRRELTEAQCRLQGWTNHAELEGIRRHSGLHVGA